MPDPVASISPAVLLELASRDYRHAGSLERAVADELGVSSVRFWQLLAGVIVDPPADVAVEWAPTIARLRRRMAAGQRLRRAG